MALAFVAVTIIECCFLEVVDAALALYNVGSVGGGGYKMTIRRDLEASVEEEIGLRTS